MNSDLPAIAGPLKRCADALLVMIIVWTSAVLTALTSFSNGLRGPGSNSGALKAGVLLILCLLTTFGTGIVWMLRGSDHKRVPSTRRLAWVTMSQVQPTRRLAGFALCSTAALPVVFGASGLILAVLSAIVAWWQIGRYLRLTGYLLESQALFELANIARLAPIFIILSALASILVHVAILIVAIVAVAVTTAAAIAASIVARRRLLLLPLASPRMSLERE